MQFTHQAQFFRSAGYRSMLAVVLPENKPAFRPFEKAGFHRIGVMGYLRLGPWRHDFCRLNRGARPVAGKTT